MANISDKKDFLRFIAQTSDEPLGFQPVRGEGVYLYDENDKAHMDLISGVSVSLLGHQNPQIIAAIKSQADKYLHTMVYGEHIQLPQVAYTKALVEEIPAFLDNVYWVNSGSEAMEGALKLAKRYTKRHEIVALRNAYHGSTHGALALMDNDYFTAAFRPLMPGVKHIDVNIHEELEIITEDTAGVVIEALQGEAGFLLPDLDYIQALRARCDDVGALLIIDEIQTGFGRTGKMWAFEHFDIEPDILCLAKALGGGLPLGCFAANGMVMSKLKSQPVLGHITTFGGHPLSCAAGLAMLNVLTENDYVSSVEAKGQLFRSLLSGHEIVKSIDGIGMMLAVEIGSFERVEKMMLQGLKKGFLTDWFLNKDTAFRIAPPLIITEEEIRKVCAIIIEILDNIDA